MSNKKSESPEEGTVKTGTSQGFRVIEKGKKNKKIFIEIENSRIRVSPKTLSVISELNEVNRESKNALGSSLELLLDLGSMIFREL